MSELNQIRTLATREDQCAGGRARAKKLSPERRREIAILASRSRKSCECVLKATHHGKLIIGDLEIDCAVLENGMRVITESSAFKVVGRQRSGRKKDRGQLPAFLSAKNLQEYVKDDFMGGSSQVEYYSNKKGKSRGYEASFIPKLCQVYLEARRAGVLTPQQRPMAAQAEIVVQALANIGITALIDECTGFQKEREKDALQQLFIAFIAKELQPWANRFPAEFFQHLKRFYGIEEMKKNPQFFGVLINKWIYKELNPEVYAELKRINPVTEAGHRKHRHHQFLTPEIGCPALEKQIQKVTTLMSISDNREDFEKHLERSKKI